MVDFTIYIGNKNYSSWSLRAWLMVKASGVGFEEVLIPLYQDGSRAALLRRSPSGKVPVLHHKGRVVWDSLAIGEYLAEQVPAAGLWPKDTDARAEARSISAEMHAGFMTLRRLMPMNMRRSVTRDIPPELQADIDRVAEIWDGCRRRHGAGGPYLFGQFTIADAMYAPVVSRFQTYGVRLEGAAQDYAETLWAYPALRQWLADAKKEPMVVEQFEL
jgi:glutathione S-transferase